jgi:two-component system, cell cycle sensor histidine kinase and response regulator CckA
MMKSGESPNTRHVLPPDSFPPYPTIPTRPFTMEENLLHAHPPVASRQLHVLHLEDTPTDRELIRFSLKGGGLHCEFTYADSQAEFEAAIKRRQFDLILSDFTIPGYHGSHALAFAHERCPDVPYVFVSGTIGEDRAIESLKAGATDYVLKERLDRLVPAVRRALREAAERHRRNDAIDALRASEERFREMAETIQDVFWAASPDLRRFLYVSPAYADIWQRPIDALYADAEEWLRSVEPADRSRLESVRKALQQGTAYRLDYRIRRPDGALKWIEERGYAICDSRGAVTRTLGVAADVTQRKELQEQLIQTQKIEAIGLLAGGVAHDFNNVLSVINGYAEMLLQSQELSPPVLEQLKQIYAAGRRAATLTRQLLVFSRRQAVNQQVIDLNGVIEDLIKMLGRLIGERVKIELDLARDLPRVNADSGMMEQIVMNLAVNARDAMREGGTLWIATSSVVVRESETPGNGRPGEYVRLSVRDTGCGIPAANLPHIFEPFFTTKPTGQGTGLGLATVHAIAQQHLGWVEVESVVGNGTTFHIFLPAETRTAGVITTPTNSAIAAGSGETILLVEDEAAVRTCAAHVLSRYGYRVLQAGTGMEAVELWQRHQSEIDLLLTDVVLPDRLSGVKLAEALRAGRPELKVVLASGYRNDVNPSAIESEKGTKFINKPYDVTTLTRVVREMLNLRR